MTVARLSSGVFDIPVAEIRSGYRSAEYFNRLREIMRRENPDQIVTMQIFQRKEDRTVCGVDEAIAIIRECAGEWTTDDAGVWGVEKAIFRLFLHAKTKLREARPKRFHGGAQFTPVFTKYRESARDLMKHTETLEKLWVSGWDRLEVKALRDGDVVQPWEPVITITGPLYLFAHLESVYLGVLARQTKISTNVRRVVNACNGKPLLFFADRFDHYATQGGDGYAAHIGGASAHASTAMGAWWGQNGVGTMPHALIATHGGDVVEACRSFRKWYPEVDLLALVDFNNDSVGDALRCLAEFGQDLKGVRLDTSGNMIDTSLQNELSADREGLNSYLKGVNQTLVRKVREALDTNGGEHVKIIVSGGFTAEKIAAFENAGCPVDVYAVGSSLLQGSNDFTADIIDPVAKVGRSKQDDSRLELVT